MNRVDRDRARHLRILRNDLVERTAQWPQIRLGVEWCCRQMKARPRVTRDNLERPLHHLRHMIEAAKFLIALRDLLQEIKIQGIELQRPPQIFRCFGPAALSPIEKTSEFKDERFVR